MPNGAWTHDYLTQQALAFLDAKANRKQTFFLYIPYCIPHGRYEVPDLEPYAGEPWPEVEKAYAAMITRMDASVGQIMEHLKQHDMDEQTLVIFSSDNGPLPDRRDFFDSAGPLRGRKASYFEGGIRVPCIARWPGKVQPGSVCRTALAFWDVLPTTAEIAGAEPPDNLDGISFLPALLGKTQPQHEFLYWKDRAVRTGRWKALCQKGKVDALWNLEIDIGERHNAIADNPDVVARIERYLAARHR